MSDTSRSLLEQLESIIHQENDRQWPRKDVIIRIGIILLCVLVMVFLIVSNTKGNTVNDSSSSSKNLEMSKMKPNSQEIWVDLSGAVNKPGVYKAEPNIRLFKLIEEAGGLSVDADRDFIGRNYNLSIPVSDQQKIYIPTIYDVQNGTILENQKVIQTQVDQLQVSNVTIQNEAQVGLNSLISINSDDLTRLKTLPGVGDITAQRIIASRPYETVNAIVEKGVLKQSLFDKIKDRLIP